MIEILKKRLEKYAIATAVQEEQALKEIVQEVALYCLGRAGFFARAAFHGGTSLRLLHGLPRFSEDLDFLLVRPDSSFDWTPYLNKLKEGLTQFGLKSQVLDRSRMDQAVRKALLKDDSVAAQLNLQFYRGRAQPALRIKLEIDVNPPQGAWFTQTFLSFPQDFFVLHQDLPSNFALKLHALLCRTYVKGRDWYDFNWYVREGIAPNLDHLEAALRQIGPWKDQAIRIDRDWVIEALSEKITALDWEQTAQDVARFLGATERESLVHWSREFFLFRARQLPEAQQATPGGSPLRSRGLPREPEGTRRPPSFRGEVMEYVSIADALFFHPQPMERYGGASGLRDAGEPEGIKCVWGMFGRAAPLTISSVVSQPFEVHS